MGDTGKLKWTPLTLQRAAAVQIIHAPSAPHRQPAMKSQTGDGANVLLNFASHDRSADFKFMDPRMIQGLGDGQFGRPVKRNAGRLFPIPQGGVDDPDIIAQGTGSLLFYTSPFLKQPSSPIP